MDMDKSDLKVRRQWLFLLFLSMAFSAAQTLWQWKHDRSLFRLIPAVQYASVAISLASSWLFGWILYRCIYRKPGTKLITLVIAVTALSLLSTPILYLSGKLPLYVPYYWIYTVAGCVMGFCWLIVSWKMRKINKRLKKLSVKSAN
jgi:hypothetical protein